MKPDLLLLHGALGGSTQLEPFANALRPEFNMHLLDFEGHALAPYRNRPYRVDHFVENVVELMDRTGIERASMFGYSMGGYVALHMATAHPSRVDRVATLGTKFRWDPETAAREAARLDPKIIQAKVPRFAESLIARHERAGGWENVLARTAQFLRDLGASPPITDESLASVQQPVLVMVGDRDNTVSADECRDVADRIPSGSLTILPDTPHPIEQVDVALLSATLRDFFD